jgi:hypothetical protein
MWFSVCSIKYKKLNDVGQRDTGIFVRVEFNAVFAVNLTEGANVRPLCVPKIDTQIISSV